MMLIELKLESSASTKELDRLMENYRRAKSELEMALWKERICMAVAGKEEAASGN